MAGKVSHRASSPIDDDEVEQVAEAAPAKAKGKGKGKGKDAVGANDPAAREGAAGLDTGADSDNDS